MSSPADSGSPSPSIHEKREKSSFPANLRRWLTSPVVAIVSGLAGPLTAFLGIALAMALSSSWFSWFDNALSDLGVSPAAPFFNGGLILCGIITLPFALRLTLILRQRHPLPGIISGLLLTASMIFLIGVGVFTENAGRIHGAVSVLFFVTLLLSGLAAGVTLALDPSTLLHGVLAIALSLAATITWILYWLLQPWNGVAIPEFISAISAYLWVIPVDIHLYRQEAPNC